MVSKATRIVLATAALAAALPAHAQTTGDGLEGFRLPPAAPDIQGPTTPDNPIIERRAPQPQPQPAPKVDIPKPAEAAKPAPTPPPARTTTPAPAASPSRPTSRPEPGTQATRPGPASTAPTPAEESTPAPVEATPTAPPASSAAPAPTASAPAPAQTTAPTPRPTAPEAGIADTGTAWWRYLVIALLVAMMGIAGVLFWRQRRSKAQFEEIMAIERPRLHPAPAAAGNGNTGNVESPLPEAGPEMGEVPAVEIPAAADTLAEPDIAGGPLRTALETLNLSVSLVNATLSYQITVTNASDRPVHNVAVFGDLVSAHSSLSIEEQLAGPGRAGAPLHQAAGLLPGQSASFSGQLRLPISAIRPVRREQAVMFIPLARMRIEAEGLEAAVVQTCVVGQKPAGPGAGLRPFRLDTGPRVYPDIGLRALDLPTPQAA